MVVFYKNVIGILINKGLSQKDIYLLMGIIGIFLIFFLITIIYIFSFVFFRSNYTVKTIIRERTSLNKTNSFHNSFSFFSSTNNTFLLRIYNNNKLSLEKGGFYSSKALFVVIFLKWFAIPVFSVLLYLLYINIEPQLAIKTSVFTFFAFEFIIWYFIIHQINKEANLFQIASYQLFKFLRNQMSAGIKFPVALNNLHTVVDDLLLKKRLLLMASHYSSTNQINESLTYITDFYNTMEAKSLALAIKQSVDTGHKDRNFKQKEKKLFNMYLNVIKKNTQFVVFRYVLIGILYAIVIVLIVIYPSVLDLMEANRSLFGN